MKIEHVAYMVEDPVAVARWYIVHLGLTVRRSTTGSPFAYFLADDSGTMMLEIYKHPNVMVPDYRSTDPLVLHLAFTSDDVEKDRRRLLDAGASAEGEVVQGDYGDQLAMLRDPWGFAIQLVCRGEPMI